MNDPVVLNLGQLCSETVKKNGVLGSGVKNKLQGKNAGITYIKQDEAPGEPEIQFLALFALQQFQATDLAFGQRK